MDIFYLYKGPQDGIGACLINAVVLLSNCRKCEASCRTNCAEYRRETKVRPFVVNSLWKVQLERLTESDCLVLCNPNSRWQRWKYRIVNVNNSHTDFGYSVRIKLDNSKLNDGKNPCQFRVKRRSRNKCSSVNWGRNEHTHTCQANSQAIFRVLWWFFVRRWKLGDFFPLKRFAQLPAE